MNSISDLIAARKEARLTQKQMADRIGLSLSAYQDMENGRSKFRKLHINAAKWVLYTINAEDSGQRS